MQNQLPFGRFDTPLESYSREMRGVKTFPEFQAIGEKYTLILDDAAPAFAAMTEESFPTFTAELRKAYTAEDCPSEEWMEAYGAVVLPKLFVHLAGPINATQMPSGFIMHRLIESDRAEIKDGRFTLKKMEGQYDG